MCKKVLATMADAFCVACNITEYCKYIRFVCMILYKKSAYGPRGLNTGVVRTIQLRKLSLKCKLSLFE